MTERLPEINARIEGMRQLGTVVNAMRGIAAARAQQARAQLAAIESFSATIAVAIGRVLGRLPSAEPAREGKTKRLAIVLFCAEQGFAGAFSERVLDAAGPDLAEAEIFLIGTRGVAVAAERKIKAAWTSAMPSQSSGLPKLADQIAEALYERIAAGDIDRLDAVFSRWQPGKAIHIERRQLYPIDTGRLLSPADANPPLTDLPPESLLNAFTADYVHAQLCDAALHAFAAENQARMETMAAAHTEIERLLASLQARQRVIRQEEITAEIIELATGEIASRMINQ